MTRVILTNHAKDRLLLRGIEANDVKKIARYGVIKSEVCDTITKEGLSHDGKPIIVIIKKENNKIIIKTTYYGN